MAELKSHSKLDRLRAFFESTGSLRMQGLDERFFQGMTEEEQVKAWNFLKDRFDLSADCIIGLFDVVTFNYWDRPIHDVFIDGKAGDSSTAYPETGGSTITGVRFRTGSKTVTWKLDGKRGTPRNGETVRAKNALRLEDVPRDAVFFAVHIYPDETVELITSRHYPRKTAKGIAMASQSACSTHSGQACGRQD